MMKWKPILFSGAMVRAILDGRKTQTRRVVKPQPDDPVERWLYDEDNHDEWVGFSAEPPGWSDGLEQATPVYRCPYGQPGDRLWVREAHALGVAGCPGGVSYRADHGDPRGDGPANPMKWRPSIYMPRWASRITLQVIEVGVEQVQSISEGDAIAEGCRGQITDGLETPSEQFRMLWNDINAKRGHSWESNPWVWKIAFEREK